jgi:hypothetical protein
VTTPHDPCYFAHLDLSQVHLVRAGHIEVVNSLLEQGWRLMMVLPNPYGGPTSDPYFLLGRVRESQQEGQ